MSRFIKRFMSLTLVTVLLIHVSIPVNAVQLSQSGYWKDLGILENIDEFAVVQDYQWKNNFKSKGRKYNRHSYI